MQFELYVVGPMSVVLASHCAAVVHFTYYRFEILCRPGGRRLSSLNISSLSHLPGSSWLVSARLHEPHAPTGFKAFSTRSPRDGKDGRVPHRSEIGAGHDGRREQSGDGFAGPSISRGQVAVAKRLCQWHLLLRRCDRPIPVSMDFFFLLDFPSPPLFQFHPNSKSGSLGVRPPASTPISYRTLTNFEFPIWAASTSLQLQIPITSWRPRAHRGH